MVKFLGSLVYVKMLQVCKI